MKHFKALAGLAILGAILYGAAQVVAAEGWINGGIFLAAVILFMSLVAGIARIVVLPFIRRGGD